MLLPEELVETISVQFRGNNRNAIREDKSLQVSVARLRAAFEWYVRHNPHWCMFGEVREDGKVKKALAVDARQPCVHEKESTERAHGQAQATTQSLASKTATGQSPPFILSSRGT